MTVRREATIGDNIKYYRTEKCMTQEKLAEKAGLSSSYISQIESGRKQIGREGLLKVAAALEIPVEWLLREQVKQNREDQIRDFQMELFDCSEKEIKIILQIALQVKRTLRGDS